MVSEGLGVVTRVGGTSGEEVVGGVRSTGGSEESGEETVESMFNSGTKEPSITFPCNERPK